MKTNIKIKKTKYAVLTIKETFLFISGEGKRWFLVHSDFGSSGGKEIERIEIKENVVDLLARVNRMKIETIIKTKKR